MKKLFKLLTVATVLAMLISCFALTSSAATTNPGKTYLGVVAGDRGEGFKFYYSTAPKNESPLENRVALDMLITNKEPWPWPEGMNYYAEKADGTNAIVGVAQNMNGITLEANVNADDIRRPMIAFTAPADGEYTYSMQAVRTLWNPGELGMEVWVGGVKNDSLYITVESGGTFTGTVHLKEGEELVFVTVNHAWETASNTVLIQDLTVKYLGDEDTYRFDLSEGSLFTMYSHAHRGENSHLENSAENPFPANFASKGNSTTTYENGVLKLQWPAMTLVYFDAPECGKYQLDLSVIGLAGPDQTANCNIYFFVGNDTDGYVRVDAQLDPGYCIQRSISLPVNLAEDDYLVIGFGNWWGAELQVDNFTVDKIVGHTGGTATCKTKAVCENCGEEYGDTLDHNYVNGTCTECGDEDPNYVPPVSPDTGDMTVTAILLGAIALISLAYAGAKKRR